MTFVNDTRHTGTLTGDARSANASFTVDTHATGQYLWQLLLPWHETFPWLITGGYPILNQDIRN